MAVNTIVINKERKLLGYNTDATGFLAHLVELQFNTRDKRIAVMGSGGSARAILAVLCMIPERPDSIKIYNRTPERLDNLLEDLSARIDTSIVEPVASIDDLDIPEADLLINTTSVGLNLEDPSLVDEELLHRKLLVYDLVYNPPLTPLLKMAQAKGRASPTGWACCIIRACWPSSTGRMSCWTMTSNSKMRQALEKALTKFHEELIWVFYVYFRRDRGKFPECVHRAHAA